MRTITALIAGASAVHVDQAATPDVYGPNGANYTNVSPSQDMARIKIDITTKGDGKGDKNEVCKDGQWAKISYKGYLKDGRQILDTAEDGQDKIFSVGASQTFKCLDLAITQMKPGAKARVECPSDLVYGGASVQAQVGGDWIPKWSDVDFDLEVSWCNHNPGDHGAGLYWSDDLTFWGGPKDLTPGSCVKIHGIKRKAYWISGTPAWDNKWFCNNQWGTYCSAWMGPEWTGLAQRGGYDFKVEKGLDGTPNTVSFIPRITEASGAYIIPTSWGGLTIGSGDNDEFKSKATFEPALNPKGDGTWSLTNHWDQRRIKGYKLSTYWGMYFTDYYWYSTTGGDGDSYYMHAEQIPCWNSNA